MKIVFFYILFLFSINSIAQLAITRDYNDEIIYYCNITQGNLTTNSREACNDLERVDNDWLYSMNFENLSK